MNGRRWVTQRLLSERDHQQALARSKPKIREPEGVNRIVRTLFCCRRRLQSLDDEFIRCAACAESEERRSERKCDLATRRNNRLRLALQIEYREIQRPPYIAQHPEVMTELKPAHTTMEIAVVVDGQLRAPSELERLAGFERVDLARIVDDQPLLADIYDPSS